MERQRAAKLAALKKANAVRARKKELRERLKRGDLDPIKLLRGGYPKWESVIAEWRVEYLVKIIPGIGVVTAQEVYEVMRLSPSTRVQALIPERREQLAKLCDQGRRITGNDR